MLALIRTFLGSTRNMVSLCNYLEHLEGVVGVSLDGLLAGGSARGGGGVVVHTGAGIPPSLVVPFSQLRFAVASCSWRRT